MIRVKENDCQLEGDPKLILTELTVAMCAFFHIIGDENKAVYMLADSIGTARSIYKAGQYKRVDKNIKDILQSLAEQEGD